MIMISLMSGFLTTLIIYKFINLFISKKEAMFGSLLLLSFPAFFIANTNILYEGEVLFFEVLGFYWLLEAIRDNQEILYILAGLSWGFSISILIGSWIMGLVYISLIIFERKFSIKGICLFIFSSLITFMSIDLAVIRPFNLIWAKYVWTTQSLMGVGDGIIISVLRMIRNTGLESMSILSISGAVICFVSLIILIRNKNKRIWLYGFWVILMFYMMQYWQVWFYGRLALFLIIPAIFIISEAVKKKNYQIVILTLIILTTGYAALGQIKKPYEYTLINGFWAISGSKNAAVITGDYDKFLYDENNISIFALKGWDDDIPSVKIFIDENLKTGRDVYIDSSGIRFPYYQYDGSFYLPVSLGKTQDAEIKKFLGSYDFENINYFNRDVFFVKINGKRENKKDINISAQYPEGVFRISKNQMFKYDILANAVYLAMQKKDPVGWKVE